MKTGKNKKKKPYLGRDTLMVELLTGSNKANIQSDRKKKTNKDKCREKVKEDE